MTYNTWFDWAQTILQILDSVFSILGINISDIIKELSDKEKKLLSICIIIIIILFICLAVLVVLYFKCRKLLGKKQHELDEKIEQLIEKTKELDAKNAMLIEITKELDDKNTVLIEKNKELNTKNKILIEKSKEIETKCIKLNEKDKELADKDEEIKAWKNILISRLPAQVGYYIANKSIFDNCKTKLVITECLLDVSLIKDTRSEKERHLHFEWTLKVLNPSETVEHAIFICSGDDKKSLDPEVIVQDEDEHVDEHVDVTMIVQKDVIGAYHFMEIPFHKPFEHHDTATIQIKYTLFEYEFNQKFDLIWFVPDALGFANINKFCIRFLHDGDVINNKTRCLLSKYELDERPYIASNIKINSRSSAGYFQYISPRIHERDKKYGYLLILINNWEKLPQYVRDILGEN